MKVTCEICGQEDHKGNMVEIEECRPPKPRVFIYQHAECIQKRIAQREKIWRDAEEAARLAAPNDTQP